MEGRVSNRSSNAIWTDRAGVTELAIVRTSELVVRVRAAVPRVFLSRAGDCGRIAVAIAAAKTRGRVPAGHGTAVACIGHVIFYSTPIPADGVVSKRAGVCAMARYQRTRAGPGSGVVHPCPRRACCIEQYEMERGILCIQNTVRMRGTAWIVQVAFATGIIVTHHMFLVFAGGARAIRN